MIADKTITAQQIWELPSTRKQLNEAYTGFPFYDVVKQSMFGKIVIFDLDLGPSYAFATIFSNEKDAQLKGKDGGRTSLKGTKGCPHCDTPRKEVTGKFQPDKYSVHTGTLLIQQIRMTMSDTRTREILKAINEFCTLRGSTFKEIPTAIRNIIGRQTGIKYEDVTLNGYDYSILEAENNSTRDL